MKKIKVLYAIDDPVDNIKEYILAGNAYPKTYLWWDYTDNSKYETYFIDNNKPRKGVLKFIERVTGLRNIFFQFEVIRKQKEYDVIFCTLDYFFFIILFSRYLKILKKPIFAYSHASLNYKTSTEKWYYKQRLRLFNYFAVKGVDYMAFMSEVALQKASEIHKISKRQNHVLHWGPDFEFYNIKEDLAADNKLYFMHSGSSNRDFKLLLDAFGELPYLLKLHHGLGDLNLDRKIPENVIFRDRDDPDFQGFNAYASVRKAYKNSFAVLVILERQLDGPMGITGVYEAMACGKPVIVTDNILHPIDVEKEGVGIKVAFGNKDELKRAVQFLIDNKDEAKKMGERAYQFIKEKRNYEIYKNELLKDFDQFIIDNNVLGK